MERSLVKSIPDVKVTQTKSPEGFRSKDHPALAALVWNREQIHMGGEEEVRKAQNRVTATETEKKFKRFGGVGGEENVKNA